MFRKKEKLLVGEERYFVVVTCSLLFHIQCPAGKQKLHIMHCLSFYFS